VGGHSPQLRRHRHLLGLEPQQFLAYLIEQLGERQVQRPADRG
jgi:hypothetical protein